MGKSKEKVTEKYITGKGELNGFIAITKPSTKFNKTGVYSANILLDKAEGETLLAKMKDIRAQQYKTYGKGTKVTDLPCKPYEIINEETGEASPDPQGRYILKTTQGAYIEKGKVGKKIMIINAKKQPVKNINVGEGTIARLGVVLSGYSVAGKTGVSAKLGLVQIIDLVEYAGGGFSLDGFDEEEGFDGVGEDFEEETTTEAEEDDEDEEEDF